MTLQELQAMDLQSIRNLFIEEAADTESKEQLKARKDRIKIIESVLEEKKSGINQKDLDLV